MKLNEVRWNLTLTPVFLQSSEAAGGKCIGVHDEDHLYFSALKIWKLSW